MNELLHLGDQIVNLNHLVRAEFKAPYAGGEEKFDEFIGETIITQPQRASLWLTLSSVELDTHIDDFNSGYYVAAASKSTVITLWGEEAVEVWGYLELIAIYPQAEMAALAPQPKVGIK